MKALTVLLPEALVAQIERESRRRGLSKSAVVRERLSRASLVSPSFAAIADLVGSVDGLPADLSGRMKRNLKSTGYGQKKPR